MTLCKHDRFAIIPTRCRTCNRLFIFEPYDITRVYIEGEVKIIDHYTCKNCIKEVDDGSDKKESSSSSDEPRNVIGFTYNVCKEPDDETIEVTD